MEANALSTLYMCCMAELELLINGIALNSIKTLFLNRQTSKVSALLVYMYVSVDLAAHWKQGMMCHFMSVVVTTLFSNGSQAQS